MKFGVTVYLTFDILSRVLQSRCPSSQQCSWCR